MLKYIIITLIIIAFNIINAACQEFKFTEEYFSSAKVYYKRKYIPHYIKIEIKKLNGYKIRFANPNRKFQETDNIINPFLANRRLILFINHAEMSVLFYEHGGYSCNTYCILIQHISKRKVKLYSIDIKPNGNNFEELKKELLKNNFHELEKFYYRF